MSHWETYKMQKEGDKVIAKVAKFEKANGRLPKSRAEMGLPDSETVQPQYQLWGNGSYILVFNLGFDQRYVYYSQFKSWDNEP